MSEPDCKACHFSSCSKGCDVYFKELSAMKQRAEVAEAALKPKPLSEGLVPHAYQLAATIQNADYWYKAGHEETNTSKAVMCMAQAMFAWKNTALAKAEDCFNYEARIKASQEQEPVGYITKNGIYKKDGSFTQAVGDVVFKWKKLYSAPVTPPDVAELQCKLDELEQAAQDEINRLEAQKLVLSNKLTDSETLRRQYFVEMCEVIEKNDKLLSEAKSNTVPDSEWLASVIRKVDGRHSLGAADLAEQIIEAMLAAAPQPGGSNE